MIEAELRRRRASDGELVDWAVNDDGTEPVADEVARQRLQDLLDRLDQALAVGGTVSLSPDTLAALEAVTASLAPGGVVDLVPATVASLRQVTAALVAGTTVNLSAGTLAALESVTVSRPDGVAVAGVADVVNLRDTLLNRLTDIFHAVDGLEVTAGNIEIASETIGLQTDEVEALLRTLRDTQPTETTEAARHVTLLAAVDGLGGLLAAIRDGVALEANQANREANQANRDAAVLAAVDALLAATGATTDTNAALTVIGRLKLIADKLPSTGLDVAAGRFYVASSGRIQLSAAGNARAIIANPAESGRSIVLQRITAYASSTGFAHLFVNPTTGVPTNSARPTLNGIVGGGVAPVGQVRVDSSLTTPLGGGTDPGVVLVVPANAVRTLDLGGTVVIPPGVTVGVNVPVVGPGDVVLGVYWSER